MDEDLKLDLINLRQYIDIGEYEEEYDEEDDDNCFYDPKDEVEDEDSQQLRICLPEEEHTQNNEALSFEENSIEACLVTNQMYQETLNDIINQLETALQSNREKQRELQEQLDASCSTENTVSHRKFWSVLKAPYFKDSKGFTCPLNEDAVLKKMHQKFDSYQHAHMPWTKKEKLKLVKAVKESTRRILMEPIMNRKEFLCEKLSSSKGSAADEIKRKLTQADNEIEVIKNMDDLLLFSKNIPGIDWISISQNDLEELRSPESCEYMWKNALHPTIFKKHWTKKEDVDLKRIATAHNLKDWDAIAEELGTKRTAVQCLQRFQTQHQDRFLTGPFSQDEHNKLVKLIESERIGQKIIWFRVYREFKERPPRVLRQHWESSIKGREVIGDFSVEEDLVLLIGLQKFGRDFPRICQYIPGRNAAQISERTRSFERGAEHATWTPEEDKKLVRLHKKLGTQWSKMAEEFDKKYTTIAIQARYNRILRNIPGAAENVDNPEFKWPSLLSHSFKVISCSRRQQYLKTYIATRIRRMESAAKIKKPVIKRSTVRLMGNSDPIDFDLRKLSAEQIDYLWDESRDILRSKWTQEDPQTRTAKTKQRDRNAQAAIDEALDKELLPYLLHKSLRHSAPTTRVYGRKESIEHRFCNDTLFQALNVAIPETLFSTYITDDSCLQEDSPSERPIEDPNPNIGKKMSREEWIIGTTKQSIQESCIALDDNSRPGHAQGILPPNRVTLNAFKLLVIDRNRLAQAAQNVKDEDAISYIVGETQNNVNCLACRLKYQNLHAKGVSHPRATYSRAQPKRDVSMPSSDSTIQTITDVSSISHGTIIGGNTTIYKVVSTNTSAKQSLSNLMPNTQIFSNSAVKIPSEIYSKILPEHRPFTTVYKIMAPASMNIKDSLPAILNQIAAPVGSNVAVKICAPSTSKTIPVALDLKLTSFEDGKIPIASDITSSTAHAAETYTLNNPESCQSNEAYTSTVIGPSESTERVANTVALNEESVTENHSSPSKNDDCKDCKLLDELRKQYELLNSRFTSIFFWPGLLSVTRPPDGELGSPQPLPQKRRRRTKAQRKLERLRRIDERTIKLETALSATDNPTMELDSSKPSKSESQQDKPSTSKGTDDSPPAKKKRQWRYCARNDEGEALSTRRSSRKNSTQ